MGRNCSPERGRDAPNLPTLRMQRGAPLVLHPNYTVLKTLILACRWAESAIQRPFYNEALKVSCNLWNTTCVCLCVLSLVQFFCSPLDCSPPGSSVHGVFQARILEWVAISFCIPKQSSEKFYKNTKITSNQLNLPLR